MCGTVFNTSPVDDASSRPSLSSLTTGILTTPFTMGLIEKANNLILGIKRSRVGSMAGTAQRV
jgi:hypothetical protein